MNRDRKRGVRASAILHGILLLLMVTGLPSFLFNREPVEPAAITVDILPIAAVSNVKMSEATPSEKKAEDEKKDKDSAKPEDKPAEKEKPSPKVNTSKDTPPPSPPPLAEAKPDVAKSKEKPPEKKPDEKPKEDPLDAILKSVRDTAATEKADKPKPTQNSSASVSPARSRSNSFDPSSPQAMSLRDAIQAQLYKCWNVPAGAKDADKLIIPLQVDYDSTGMPTRVMLNASAQNQYNTDGFFRAAADSAIRAVRACAPLQGMPPETYSIWQYVDINFNPKDMLL